MKVQKYNHFTITVLVKCVLDIVVQNFNFVSANTCIHKSIDMSLQSSRQPFLNNIGANIQIFQFRISFSWGKNTAIYKLGKDFSVENSHTGCLIWIWDILQIYHGFVFGAKHFSLIIFMVEKFIYYHIWNKKFFQQFQKVSL